MVFTRKLKFYDALFISKWDGFNWSTPENITNQVGSDGDHYPTGLSHDGTRLLLTSFNMFTGDDIHETRFENGKWSKIEKLEDNVNSAYSENHASFHPDNQTIYFTSNRPGGLGGYDIYFTERGPDGQWLPAKNMGPGINTPYHEQTPFLASNRKYLFFSSQGHRNLGGYDLFFSRGSGNGKWEDPLNLGYPLNTTGDELFFSPYMDEPVFIAALYMEDSQGETDLYRVSLLEPLPVAEERKNILHGKVKDISSVVDINQVEIRLTRIEDQYTLITRPDTSGDFQFETPKPGWHVLSIAGDNLMPVHDTIEIQSSNEPLYREHLLYSNEAGTDTIIIEGFVDILFAFDSHQLPREAIPILETIREAMDMHPNLRVVIMGHTDNSGNREYNFRLSGKRAESVQQYLIEKGIQPGRLHTKATGPDSPAADNLTREGRTRNRRVSFKVEGDQSTDTFRLKN
jgi:outer membrane protein OmpA-like peptidoglycan-associated protein